MKKFAVILSGCGVFDGSEIHEAVLTLLAIDRNGAKYEIFAPDMDHYHIINHLTGEKMKESRNVLVESARIARGKIKPLREFHADAADALVIPGGFGSAKNLCTWAYEGDKCQVNPEVEKAVLAMHSYGKPVGALCISPVILSKLLKGLVLTTGDDGASRGFIEKMGGVYRTAGHGEVVIDKPNKVYSTPCYMLDATISQVADGADHLIKEMLKSM